MPIMINANMPLAITENMTFERHIFSTGSTKTIISTFSEYDGNRHILRVFQLMYNNVTLNFDYVQELEAFSFKTHHNLSKFLDQLPFLNGIEMLLALNPVD